MINLNVFRIGLAVLIGLISLAHGVYLYPLPDARVRQVLESTMHATSPEFPTQNSPIPGKAIPKIDPQEVEMIVWDSWFYSATFFVLGLGIAITIALRSPRRVMGFLGIALCAVLLALWWANVQFYHPSSEPSTESRVDLLVIAAKHSRIGLVASFVHQEILTPLALTGAALFLALELFRKFREKD